VVIMDVAFLVGIAQLVSSVQVWAHANAHQVVQVVSAVMMAVVVHVEFVPEKIHFAKMVTVLVQETAPIANVAPMVVQHLVVHAELMKFVLLLDIVFSLVVMVCVIIQKRIQLLAPRTVSVVVIISVILERTSRTALWIVQTFAEMEVVRLESRQSIALKTVLIVVMVFVKHLAVRMFSLVKLIVVLVATRCVNVPMKIQLFALRIVGLAETMFVMSTIMKIINLVLKTAESQFVVMEDVMAKKQVLVVQRIAQFRRVMSCMRWILISRTLFRKRIVVLVVKQNNTLSGDRLLFSFVWEFRLNIFFSLFFSLFCFSFLSLFVFLFFQSNLLLLFVFSHFKESDVN